MVHRYSSQLAPLRATLPVPRWSHNNFRHELRRAALLLLFAALGCGGTATTVVCGDGGAGCPAASESAAEIGYVELPEAAYTLGAQPFTASRVRLFYGFIPVATPDDRAPIFVLSGGGPAASAMFLLAYLAPNAIDGRDDAGNRVVANATALNQLGHVLAIDARNAGFSYSLLEDPSSRESRTSQFSVENYNPYLDAADTWQVLFAFWDRHPSLIDHPVYLLTESYGALRVGLMLELLFSLPVDGPARFRLPALETRLHEFEQRLTLGGQILIEPWFAGTRQAQIAGEQFEAPDSILDQLAAEVGATYQRCAGAVACDPYANAVQQLAALGRSVYDYRRGPEWLDAHVTAVANAVTTRASLAQIGGIELDALDAVLGSDRSGAYRFADASHGLFTTKGDLELTLGELEPWDSFFVPLNTEARDAFLSPAAEESATSPNRPEWGDVLLRNARRVRTFITRAKYDLLIYGHALVPVLASYPGVESVSLVAGASSGTAAPSLDEILVEFADGTSSRIISPEYASSHSIARDEPTKIIRDLELFVKGGASAVGP